MDLQSWFTLILCPDCVVRATVEFQYNVVAIVNLSVTHSHQMLLYLHCVGFIIVHPKA
uniref:Uncharacterized protein n=1 Tax=Rhizophora mucronata TaxID=61149 RepID=A0A2P2QPT9_RHIMU